MAYCARVSSPANQANPDYARLLAYCIRHAHWSVFEQADMTVDVTTSLAVATQMLRHRSFCFQQFSQRYAAIDLMSDTTPVPHLRLQDTANRQNSIDALPQEQQEAFQARCRAHFDEARALYGDMLSAGVAKECARFVLPQCSQTRLYMKGSCRSWVHYLQLRCGDDTQAEHREVARAIRDVFCGVFPVVARALGWSQQAALSGCQDFGVL